MERNSWKLCSSHRNCQKCSHTLASWKTKAGKHSKNAQNLKFVLMCIMDERSEPVIRDETGHIPYIVPHGEGGKKMGNKCGICREHYEYGGRKNMVALNCSHTVCVSCVNALIKVKNHEEVPCPYCRQEIKKAVNLHYDEPEPDSDSDDEPINLKSLKL